MFCNQCQEAMNNRGCHSRGVCGKSSEVSDLQDQLVHELRALAEVLTALRQEGEEVKSDTVAEGLFMTITNANFDDGAIGDFLKKAAQEKESLLHTLSNQEGLSEFTRSKIRGKEEAIEGLFPDEDEDIRSLKETVLYGLKGAAAYLTHARRLGFFGEEESATLDQLLAKLNQSLSLEEGLSLVLTTGKLGVSVMALLDEANNSRYGHPELSEVRLDVNHRPGILISGHDLKDLEELLEATKDQGIDIYTHSEMLPAHYYPAFKKYDHFIGNYGNAWWKQREEFEAFQGPILMTTNCIVPPKESYRKKLFTTGMAGYPGCPHIEEKNGKKDFSALIEAAKNSNPPTKLEEGSLLGGFAHDQVFALADKVVEAVKSGAIRKFVVMAGCDGRHKERDYYREFAEKLPKDTVILTAGCAKYRYNKLSLGDIGGIPRVLDAGQCNDSYSLALIALKLKEAFELSDINELPIVYNIAWYEQKAVIVLLALLSLGVKNIHLGPTLPAFLSPNVTQVLVKEFGISARGDVEEDLLNWIGEKAE